ncbi:MAG: NADPH-dependent reductase [Phycisphaerales bacterium]|jgi:chromate reductase|nr:NADPH-dependent reductase [Phycisphaerales bacterium]
MDDHSILIISGTNRPSSNTLRVARIVEQHYAAAGVHSEFLSLTDLPLDLFAPDAYTRKPPALVTLQQMVLKAAGLHIVLPEYNGSFPGVLKYFIDMLKFPESFDRKPVAFVGVANGQFGGVRAVEHLQMVFAYRNAHLYPDRIFVPTVQHKLDSQGNLTDAALEERISKQVRGFAEFSGLFVKRA